MCEWVFCCRIPQLLVAARYTFLSVVILGVCTRGVSVRSCLDVDGADLDRSVCGDSHTHTHIRLDSVRLETCWVSRVFFVSPFIVHILFVYFASWFMFSLTTGAPVILLLTISNQMFLGKLVFKGSDHLLINFRHLSRVAVEINIVYFDSTVGMCFCQTSNSTFKYG